MLRSRFRSSTRLAVVALVALGCLGCLGCGDDECGVGDAPAVGLVVSSADVTLTFGNLTSIRGNDCSDPERPNVISVTIEGTQTDGTGLITVCLARPDLLNKPDQTIGSTMSTADIRIIDAQGTFAGCSFVRDGAAPTSGVGTGSGVCDAGTHPDGFAISLDAALSLQRTCGPTVDSIAVTLTGTAAVTPRM